MPAVNPSYSLMRSFFLHDPAGKILYDKDGCFIQSNEAAHKSVRADVLAVLSSENLFDTGFFSSSQQENLHNGRSIRITAPHPLTVYPAFDEEKRLCGYILSVDVFCSQENTPNASRRIKELEKRTIEKETENKVLTSQLSESYKMIELALENTRVTVYSFNFERFRTCDKINCNRCFQFYGATNSLLQKNQYICRALSILRAPDDRTDFFYLFDKIRKEKLEEYSTVFKLKSDTGEYRSYEVIGKGHHLNDTEYPDLIVGYIIDNEEHSEYERNLIREKEKAQNADQLKSTFLANMTHDIRTPLNAIVGFSDLLSIETDPEIRRHYLDLIKTNNDFLVHLINDVLDLSKIEANMLTFDYTDTYLPEVITDLYHTLRFRTTGKVELILDEVPDIRLHTDSKRLTQVLMNLLTNALKHTQEGSIRFGYRTENESIRFYVSDTGEGIPEKEQEKIFSRFVQLKGHKQGIGLGLAICKGIVNQMGGDIRVSSRIKEGTTFEFRLPLYQKGPVLFLGKKPE